MQNELMNPVLSKVSKSFLDLSRRVLRRLPRGSGTLYKLLGGYREGIAWDNGGFRTTTGIEHGYRMTLDLSDPVERETYYLGRFFEWELEGVFSEFLQKGDVFIDVGANIGMVTLSAARKVGRTGRILSFEPNPPVRARLVAHVKDNEIGNVTIFDVALGKEPGSATLSTATKHTGTGTLRKQQTSTASHVVTVATLNDYVKDIPAGQRVFLKIDTEGYDFNVLQGATELLRRENVVVFAELSHKWLGELGQTAEEMFTFMGNFGFAPFHPSIEKTLSKRRLKLEPLTLPGPHHWFNVLFMRKSGQDKADGSLAKEHSGASSQPSLVD